MSDHNFSKVNEVEGNQGLPPPPFQPPAMPAYDVNNYPMPPNNAYSPNMPVYVQNQPNMNQQQIMPPQQMAGQNNYYGTPPPYPVDPNMPSSIQPTAQTIPPSGPGCDENADIYIDPDPPKTYSNYQPYSNGNYRRMAVDQWHRVPFVDSSYSKLWKNEEQYSPEKFHKNMRKKKNKCNSIVMLILFLLNAAGSIAFFCYLVSIDDDKIDLNPDGGVFGISFKEIGMTVLLGLVIGIVITGVHYAMLTAGIHYYMSWLILVVCAALVGSSFFFWQFGGNIGPIIFCIVFLLTLLIGYAYMKKVKGYTRKVISYCMKQIRKKFHSLFGFCFIHLFITFVLCLGYTFMIYLVQKHQVSNFSYIYIVFSFYWVTRTISYMEYMTDAGLCANWYFLHQTEYFPKRYIWKPYKRALRNLGVAARSAIFMPVMNFLRQFAILDLLYDPYCLLSLAVLVVQVMFHIVLFILELMLGYLIRHALVYVAIFNIPLINGSDRFKEVECSRITLILTNGCLFNRQIGINFVGFVIAAGLFGYGIAYAMLTDKEILRILMAAFATMFTYSAFLVMNTPILAFTDAFIVCFGESPNTLKVFDDHMYRKVVKFYDKILKMNTEKYKVKDGPKP
ncbi:hypothetical protein TRFO_21895 [Tritrichomonas foetus]|uniref:Choline transporter-like protein n=1 Tax=Tritrichomonas foetus TaxID=1144522 RepID=A0A1J4KCV3_9EUKA|nr:hypothetical protein TRFO_21895 [Tritrichomonas foetus]|eukprot:OHT09249.1 hypothetical protein TRFO_21895 [Tritrichomonas foetus]